MNINQFSHIGSAQHRKYVPSILSCYNAKWYPLFKNHRFYPLLLLSAIYLELRIYYLPILLLDNISKKYRYARSAIEFMYVIESIIL